MGIIALLVVLALAAPTWAQEPSVALPRPEAADLFSKAGELALRTAKVQELEAKVAILEQREALKAELDGLRDQKLALQAELTRLAKEEAAYWKGRVEALEASSANEVRRAKLQGYATMIGCGVGVLATPFLPVVSTMAGCALGAGVGAILP